MQTNDPGYWKTGFGALQFFVFITVGKFEMGSADGLQIAHVGENKKEPGIMNQHRKITLDDIIAARTRIAEFSRHTPLKRASALSRQLGVDVRLKLESMQDIGSFKIRGAANRMLKLAEEKTLNGVVAVSSGNHGRAVSRVAGALGIPATIFMTHLVPANKVDGIRQLGATVVIHGEDQDEAESEALRIAERDGLEFISPFDDRDVIAGQGSIALEILEDWPEVETLLVPLSGGGLIGGIAIAVRAIKPEVQIVGVTTTHSAAMVESIKAGHVVSAGEEASLADALPGPIPVNNQYTFELCKTLVDDIVQISEDDIARGMVFALQEERLVLEGAGAIGIAHLLAAKSKAPSNCAIVCSGGNVDVDRLISLSQQKWNSDH